MTGSAKNRDSLSDLTGTRAVRIRFLGNFELFGPDGAPILIPTKKNRGLLCILALSPGRQVTRERLCGLLWGDLAEVQARSSLRQSLAALRKELGNAETLVLQTWDDLVKMQPIAPASQISNASSLIEVLATNSLRNTKWQDTGRMIRAKFSQH